MGPYHMDRPRPSALFGSEGMQCVDAGNRVVVMHQETQSQGEAGPLSPIVSHTVRVGAILMAVGSAAYVAAMIVCQLAYPGYSVIDNAMSDLGNTSTSALWYVFSAGLATLGLFWVIGSVSISGSMRGGVSCSREMFCSLN